MRSSGALVRLVSARAPSLLLPLAACASLTLSCGETPPTDAVPRPLRFGIFTPDAKGSREELAVRYQPVVTYLETRLSQPVELVVSPDAGAMLSDFESGRFDVIFHRAFAFPHAQTRVGAIPLATRQEDRQSTSVFLALATDPRQSLQDFHDARLEFSLRLGSSYVMGRHYLEQQHIDLDTFFRETHFSNVADEAIERLLHGPADLCVVNSIALLRMFDSGVLAPTDVKIVAETPPHVGELWFSSVALPANVRMKVRDAFLLLSPDDAEHAAVLKVLAASAYLPTTLDDYRQLTDLMRRMQVLDVDIRQLR